MWGLDVKPLVEFETCWGYPLPCCRFRQLAKRVSLSWLFHSWWSGLKRLNQLPEVSAVSLLAQVIAQKEVWDDAGLSSVCRVGTNQILEYLCHFVLGDLWSCAVQIRILIWLWWTANTCISLSWVAVNSYCPRQLYIETGEGNFFNSFPIKAQLMFYFPILGTTNAIVEMATPLCPQGEVVHWLWAQAKARDFTGSKLWYLGGGAIQLCSPVRVTSGKEVQVRRSTE